MTASTDAPLPPLTVDRLRERYEAFVQARLAERPIHGRWTELGFLLPMALLKPRVLRLFWTFRFETQSWESFLQNAVPVMGYTLMFEPEQAAPTHEASPGIVLVSFDMPLDRTRELMLALHEKMVAVDPVTDRETAQERLRTFIGPLADGWRPNSRHKVPREFTDPYTIYACNVLFSPRLLMDGHVGTPTLPCMAEPGDQGRIAILPWWIGKNVPEPVPSEPYQPFDAGIMLSASQWCRLRWGQ